MRAPTNAAAAVPPEPEPEDPTARIRRAILQGVLFPNQHLGEAELAQRLGVNRAAVRLALAVLEQQGLVIRERNRGARVRVVTAREAIEIMELRAVIEAVVARDAARHAGPADVAQLRALHQELGALLAAGDLPGYSLLNVRFHAAIARISRHATGAVILDSLHSQTVAFQYRPIREPGRARSIEAEHAALLAAIAGNDDAAAEAAMRTHLDNAVLALRATIAARPRPDPW